MTDRRTAEAPLSQWFCIGSPPDADLQQRRTGSRHVSARMLKTLRHSRQVFTNTAYLAFATLAAKASILALFLVATRVLDQDSMGRYVLVTGLLGILQSALTFGTQMYMPKEVARDPQFAGRSFVGVLVIQEVLAVLSVPVLFGFLAMAKYDSQTCQVVAAFMPMVFLLGPVCLVDAILLGWEDARTLAILQVLVNGSVLLLGSIALISAGDVKALGLAYLISYVLIGLAGVAIIFRRADIAAFNRRRTRGLLAALSPFAVVSLLDAVKNRADVVFLSRLITYEQLATYGAAYRLFDGIRLLVSYSYATAAYPRMAESISRGESPLAVYRAYVTVAAVASSLVAVMLFGLADILVKTLYPTTYAAGGLIVGILCISLVLDAVNAVSARTLFLLEKPGAVTQSLLLSALSNIVLNITLIPRMGAIGAAVATDLTYIVYSFCLVGNLWRHFRSMQRL